MDLADIQAITDTVVAVASVGTLVAVAVQLRSLAQQTRYAAHQTEEASRQSQAASDAIIASLAFANTDALLTVDQFLADRPAIRRELYGPVNFGPDTDDAQRTEGAAEMLVDMFEGVLTNTKYLSPDLRAAWVEYIKQIMDSPVALGYWLANREWYGIELRTVIDDILKSRSKQPPPEGLIPEQR